MTAKQASTRTSMSDPLRLFRTLRHLRASQIGYRLRRRVRSKWERLFPARLKQRIDRDLPSELQPSGDFPRSVCCVWGEPQGERVLRELQQNSLTLYHQTLPFQGGADWRLPRQTRHRLWTSQLHCHDWIGQLAERFAATGEEPYAKAVEHYLSDWLANCPLGGSAFDETAWSSYCIATRLGWWSRLYHLLGEGFWQNRPQFKQDFLESFALQAAYLESHLEWDLRANHLFRDAVGLAWAGRFLGESRWLEQAAHLASAQLEEQVLPDGGHFERSPMYHLHFMEDLWFLSQLLPNPTDQQAMRQTWLRMAECLRWLRHPDGGISLLNDAAQNGTASPQNMLQREPDDAEAPHGGRHLPHFGTVVWHGELWTLFFDVGEIGPDYQPGHAHADTLTLECSYQGDRLIVDPGTYAYDRDDRRGYDRSTAAHNTVCIDAQNSSEVWHIFRVGRRAQVHNVQVEFQDTGIMATATHDGYRHLPGSPEHTRKIEVTSENVLRIVDRVAGAGTHEVSMGLLFAPQWSAAAGGDAFDIASADGERRLRLGVQGDRPVKLAVEEAPYHPEFGREIMASRAVWKYRGELPLEVLVEIRPA